jgi:hypothetical protein
LSWYILLHDLYYGIEIISDYTGVYHRMAGSMNWRGFEQMSSRPNRGITQTYIKRLGKTTKMISRDTRVPDDIRTEHLQTLLSIRHTDSSAKFICDLQPAVNRSTGLRTSMYMQRFISYRVICCTPALSFILEVDTRHQHMCDF